MRRERGAPRRTTVEGMVSKGGRSIESRSAGGMIAHENVERGCRGWGMDRWTSGA